MSITSEEITEHADTGSVVPTGSIGRAGWHSIGSGVAALPLLTLQLLGLWALNLGGVWAVEAMQVPIPGNLVGMLGLYLLLSLRFVKVSWFDTTGSFLIKHLAFFFIPITVGLMDAGGLLAMHGVAIAVTLIVSATGGILLSGLVAQLLTRQTVDAGGGRQ